MGFFRNTLRVLSKGRTFRRRLPSGPSIFVTGESQLKYLKPGRGAFDISLLAIVEEFIKPNDIVWDIGANVGVFGFSAAGKGAQVLAVEADPYLANLLLQSKAHVANAALNIDILSAAISSRSGIARLRFSTNGRASNSLAESITAETGRKFQEISALVATVTLDDLLEISHPSFCKIDIEGAELLAFQGAPKLLRDIRPILYFECYSEIAQPVADLLHGARYKFFDGNEPSPRVQIEMPAYNTIAIPE